MWQKLVQDSPKRCTNNLQGVAKRGNLETKLGETVAQMTVGLTRSYKFVPFGLKGLIDLTDGVTNNMQIRSEIVSKFSNALKFLSNN